jgi:molybdopterin-guanine dinucleotide biosynthesis protein B
MAEPRLFGIAGWKNSGKTTLLAALVTELTARGYRVSTIKHAHHEFDIDHKGRDSYKHREAGAHETLIVSQRRLALMREMRGDPEPSLPEIVSMLAPCDLVLVEGYKREAIDRLEIVRDDPHSATRLERPPLWPHDRHVVAIASESRPDGCELPLFHPDAIPAIADFVVGHCGLDASVGMRTG